MNTADFRVGNLIMHPVFGTPTPITAIAFNGVYIGREGGVPFHIDEVKRVALTPTIMEQLQFQNNNDPEFWYLDIKGHTDGLYFHFNPRDKGGAAMQPYDDDEDYTIRDGLIWLDEMQNLYWSCVGTEMPVDGVIWGEQVETDGIDSNQ